MVRSGRHDDVHHHRRRRHHRHGSSRQHQRRQHRSHHRHRSTSTSSSSSSYSRRNRRHHHHHHHHHHQSSLSRSPTLSRLSSRSPSWSDAALLSSSSSSSSPSSSSSSFSRGRSGSGSSACDDEEAHLIAFPGDVIAHRYEVIATSGEGKFSKVVEAYDRAESRVVAIKIVRAVPRYHDSARTEISILEAVSRRDAQQQHSSLVVRFFGSFEWKGHTCIVFERCGISLYDFLVRNRYTPFAMDHIRDIARQLIHSLRFIHEMQLCHTDLKPENCMLVHSTFVTAPVTQLTCANPGAAEHSTTRLPVSTEIRLIDLGNAVWTTRSHTSIIATRHYRAPEVLLGMEWGLPSDMFSVGCILAELFTGDVLFQTHHNREHLAMMERVLGQIPPAMARRAGHTAIRYFDQEGRIVFPEPGVQESMRHVNAMAPLDIVVPSREHPDFFDLVARLLEYDPERRMTAAQALQHPFFVHKEAASSDDSMQTQQQPSSSSSSLPPPPPPSVSPPVPAPSRSPVF